MRRLLTFALYASGRQREVEVVIEDEVGVMIEDKAEIEAESRLTDVLLMLLM